MSNPIDISKMKGLFTPILTPVDAEEHIDEAKLRRQVDFVIEHGVDGILAFGSNSEFYMFDDDEMIEGTRIILDQAAGRVPVIFGVGHISTRACIALAKRAAELPIDGIAVLHPMFIKPTNEALVHHYTAIANAVPDTFVFIYHNPGRCGYALPNDVIVELAHTVPNILGIKDSTGDITALQELIRRCSDIDFVAFVGKDTVVFPGLCCGADGTVCSTGNISQSSCAASMTSSLLATSRERARTSSSSTLSASRRMRRVSRQPRRTWRTSWAWRSAPRFCPRRPPVAPRSRA